MKKSFYFAMHALVWTVAIGITVLLGYDGYSGFFIFKSAYHGVNALLASIWMLVIFYTFYLWVFPKYFKSKKYILFSIVSILIVGIYPLIFSSMFSMVHYFFNRGECYKYISSAAYFGGIIAVIFIGGLGSAYRMVIDWFTFAKEKDELEKQNLHSHLQLLKYKINPHFLFNTLNNIDSLISNDQEKASMSLNKLSEMMRYMIYDAERDQVTLKEEMKYIENYVHLQNIRTSYPDNHKLVIKGSMENVKISPMLFIPLIENAFKHSALNNKDTIISISIEIEDQILVMTCINTIPANAIEKDNSSGVGMDIIKKRLELIYPDKHELNVSKDSGNYRVILKIDLNEN